ncbi:MAG: hypothetical protein HYV42_04350 [Candidatus Magasanikbacteria bacterium]|nr:hypothetical protein [Candidatus Magasanikbacteria bacterium]
MAGLRSLRSPRHFRRYQPGSTFSHWWLRTRRLRNRRRLMRMHNAAAGAGFYPRITWTFNLTPILKRGGLLLILIIAWAGLLLFLPFFRIKRIITLGAAAAPDAAAVQAVLANAEIKNFLPPTNYFLLRERTLAARLENQFPLFAVTAERIFPHTLKITFSPRARGAIYDTGKAYFFLDEQGIARQKLGEHSPIISASTTVTTTPLGKLPPTQLNNASTTRPASYAPDTNKLKTLYGDYPVIFDERTPTTTETGEKIFTADFIAGLAEWHQSFAPGRGEGIYYTVQDPRAGVIAFSPRRYQIRFQPDKEIAAQLANLQLLLQQQKPQEYIDVRFADRLFWR